MQPSSFRKERGSLPTDTKRTAMTTENPFPWADGMNCAVTVCATEGVILYMNEKARATYSRLTAEGGSNAYTIEKQGVRKMIYQTAWRTGDKVGGLVEISMEIPAEMPHYIRG